MALTAATTSHDDFFPLPIQMPSLPAFPHPPVVHEIRLRRHTPRIPTETDRRTLFLKNIPADSTEPHLRAVFSQLVGPGRFEAAFFEDGSRAPLMVDPERVVRVRSLARKRKRGDDDGGDNDNGDRSDDDGSGGEDEERNRQRKQAEAANLPEIWDRRIRRSGSSAVVLLADEKCVSLVLKAVGKLQKSKKHPVWGGEEGGVEEPLGGPWIARHISASRTRTEHAAPVRAAVRALFAVVNAREKEAALLAKRLRSEPDADGFVTVTRGSGARTTPASRVEAEETRRKMLERAARKKDETSDFYRFQRRQRLKREHEALKSRFDEDRERVRAMREKRGVARPEA